MSDLAARTNGSSFDAQKAEAFAGRMMSALNDGALGLMASIGHRTGLFDAMRDQSPQTSSEIAARAGLDERYVREWLGAMVTSGVVVVDPQTVRFHLPAEHAAFLTRPAGSDNLAQSRAAHPASRHCRGRHRRLLQEGRRRSLRTVSAIPRRHGRGRRR